MAALILYAFSCITTTFAGSYIVLSDQVSGLTNAQINHIIVELKAEDK